jgi:acyl carrier protein phosphodiesterase
MNHTAHCLLSYPDGDDLLGNFIGDFVKGKSWQQYPETIQAGILRHRNIDAFTDAHPVVRTSVDRIRPFAGKFSAPVVDILYDHLLYRHWNDHTDVAFGAFESWVYGELERRRDLMPDVLRERWPRMYGGRFLRSYTTEKSMRLVLERFAGRLPLPVDALGLSNLFFNELPVFDADFRAFFPELQKHVAMGTK